MKSLREIVDRLREQGHSVHYIKREGGSIEILSIDSERFRKGSRAGNRKARMLSGETLRASTIKARKEAGEKAARLTNIKKAQKPKKHRVKSRQERNIEKQLNRMGRVAKKHGLKRIGKKQVKQAMKRGKKWKDIKKDIIETYKSRYSKIASDGTREGLAIYLHDWGLAPTLEAMLRDKSRFFLARDVQDCHDAAYDATHGDGEFNESYWIKRFEANELLAKDEAQDLRSFERELKRK